MKVVKIKYRGEWRKVIGMSTDPNGRLCYKVQCLDFPTHYNKIPIYDYFIEEKVERDVSRYPSSKTPYKELSEETKGFIRARFESGVWTLKEICDMFNITRLTVKKIVGVL